jgi:hypothetical protein
MIEFGGAESMTMFESVNETRLANGVRVVSSALPYVQSVSLGIWVGVGSRHESKAMGGASHFLDVSACSRPSCPENAHLIQNTEMLYTH